MIKFWVVLSFRRHENKFYNQKRLNIMLRMLVFIFIMSVSLPAFSEAEVQRDRGKFGFWFHGGDDESILATYDSPKSFFNEKFRIGIGMGETYYYRDNKDVGGGGIALFRLSSDDEIIWNKLLYSLTFYLGQEVFAANGKNGLEFDKAGSSSSFTMSGMENGLIYHIGLAYCSIGVGVQLNSGKSAYLKSMLNENDISIPDSFVYPYFGAVIKF